MGMANAEHAEETRSKESGAEILLVEDEEALRAVMRSYLQNKGYAVLDAADPSEAIELAEGAPLPPFNAAAPPEQRRPLVDAIEKAVPEKLLPAAPK